MKSHRNPIEIGDSSVPWAVSAVSAVAGRARVLGCRTATSTFGTQQGNSATPVGPMVGLYGTSCDFRIIILNTWDNIGIIILHTWDNIGIIILNTWDNIGIIILNNWDNLGIITIIIL